MLQTLQLEKKTPRTLTAVTETMVLTVLGIILGYWFIPGAAFFSVPGFSWLMVGPFLSGLRYGFAYALNSALFLIGCMWIASQYFPAWNSAAFSSTALALLFISIVAGEFNNYWTRQINKLQATADYLDNRLGEVTNAFNMLKISHERLAQRAASRSTLRDSILAVRTRIMKAKLTDADMAGLGALILRIFADYTSIQQAGLFALKNDGEINTNALASFGGHFQIKPDDLLLQQALNNQKTTNLKPELVTEEEYSNLLLLAIPLVDVMGQVWGVVLVNKMPFRAFRPENIRLAAILGGHIADLISMRYESNIVEDVDLQCFMLQVKRCMNDIKVYDLPGSMVAMQLGNDKDAEAMSALISGRQRGLDSAWMARNRSGKQCLLVLLPLTDLHGVEGYRNQLQKMIAETYGYADLRAANIQFYEKSLAQSDSLQALLLGFFQQLDIDHSYWAQQDLWQQ
jgi:polysaccharide biosynthesis protein PelD